MAIDHSLGVHEWYSWSRQYFLQNRRTSDNYDNIKVKVMMHKSRKKVIFVEAGEYFVESLFSFLTIPLGVVVVSLLSGNICVGNVDNLYKSTVSSLDVDKYLKSEKMKDSLLHFKVGFKIFVPELWMK